MDKQMPSVGRIVHYKLSAQDVEQINRRRTTSSKIAERLKTLGADGFAAWPEGAQAHIGNEAHENDVLPMLIIKVWGSSPESSVNGQVFLDGNDVFWATSRSCGELAGQWVWPPRV